jgi:hypothetical protein
MSAVFEVNSVFGAESMPRCCDAKQKVKGSGQECPPHTA